MSRLVLRGYWRSSCTWRVRIALEWKGLPFETVPVHLLRDGGEQHASGHAAQNPMEQVPVLLVDGRPLSQSLAILEYLEEVAPEPPLLPRDPIARARARQLAEVVNSGIQPLQNLAVMQMLMRDHGLDREATQAWSRHWIDRGFAALERLVAAGGGPYAAGDQVTVADVCLVPQLYNARRFEMDLAPFPALLRVEEALLRHDAFRVSHPDRQPDAEPTR